MASTFKQILEKPRFDYIHTYFNTTYNIYNVGVLKINSKRIYWVKTKQPVFKFIAKSVIVTITNRYYKYVLEHR